METAVFKPELWNDFFVIVGGGVAALTGLIFVALSLNLANMTKDATHKYRSINTLAGLTAVFVRCALVVMPEQTNVAVGLELFTVASIGALIFLYGFRRAFQAGSNPSKLRLLIGTLLYIVELVGALVLISGSVVGLYIAAAAIVLNVAFMVSAAWLLVVGVFDEDRPVKKA